MSADESVGPDVWDERQSAQDGWDEAQLEADLAFLDPPDVGEDGSPA